MQAATLVEPRRFELREVERPEPDQNQVLVRLEGCGLCASNLPPFEGRPWFKYPMAPGALGHEAWGTVERLGTDVRSVREGDRVGILSQYAYAEWDVADSGSVVPLPAALARQPFPAEPLGCALNIWERSKVERNDTVAIVGIGFLGALLTQLASTAGAMVIAISRRSFALACARQMGAAHTIHLEDEAKVVDEVRQLTGGKLCDVVIEAVGKQGALTLAAELTRERGRLVVAGYHQDGPRQINMQLWNWRGLNVINAHERDPGIYLRGMQAAVRAVESGMLNPRPLYTHRFPLAQINEAFRVATARPDEFMKALLIMR